MKRLVVVGGARKLAAELLAAFEIDEAVERGAERAANHQFASLAGAAFGAAGEDEIADAGVFDPVGAIEGQTQGLVLAIPTPPPLDFAESGVPYVCIAPGRPGTGIDQCRRSTAC